jgi:glycerophosphoryl diester phosphodiesterase
MHALRWVAALTACALLPALSPAEEPRVYAHRGATASAPENSLAACAAAFALGASCEVDVRAARDGALVLMHDASVARTTNARGRIARLTLAQLRGLSLLGSAGEHVPTLEQVLALARGGQALLLDLKREDDVFHARLANALADAPESAGVVLGVRSGAQARALRALLGRQEQVALIGSPREIEALSAAGAEQIRLELGWLSRDDRLAARVRASGARLLVLVTGRGQGAIDAALSHAPDALLCDDPVAALARIAAHPSGGPAREASTGGAAHAAAP